METFVSAAVIGVTLGSQYALLALGFTLIFGILGVINFSHGGFYVLGGYLAYAASSKLGLPFPLAVFGAAVCTAAVGFVFERWLVERVVEDHEATLILTLGFYLVMSTLLLAVFGPESPEFRFPVSGAVQVSWLRVSYENLIVQAVSWTAIGIVYVLIYRTDFGRALRALADDRIVAATQGVRPRLLFPLAFGLATGLAGLTGALVTPILSLSPHLGDAVLAMSFITVILGGLGSVGGAVVGAFVVGLVEAYSSVYLGGSKGALVLFVLILAILLVKPAGLFGREVRGA